MTKHHIMFVFVSLLRMGSFINGGLTSGLNEDANVTITRSSKDKERQTLLGFKANLVDISNILYYRWDVKEDCCRWVGVGCNNQTGHVTTLDMSIVSDSLSGSISPLLSSLSQLDQLQYLDLSGINFQFNHIPDSLSSLSNLQYLKMSAANLSGIIPVQLAYLSNLLHLNLSSNFLSGPIPASFVDLSSLTHLDLSGNQLEGVIPTYFGNWSSLVQLVLSKNLLNGSVPNFARYPSLHKLDLSRNRLTGTLPDSVGKLSNLEYLDVSSNSLQGLISDVHLLNLTQLTYLDLSFNSFELNLSSNATIRFQLKIIKMQSCKLGPSFPMWIQTQRDFAYLDISNAGISDGVPEWFWDLPRGLRFLNLSSNEIKGKLPDITTVFDCFPGMDLSNNQLEGMIPLLPSKLAALNLSRNRFSGTLSFLCQIDVALSLLDLSSNLLSGRLPDCWLKFQEKLVVLNLSNNSLSGEIPSSLGSLSELRALYLRRNAFVGEIPMSLSNCKNLRFLDAGENKLSGNIPSWIGETLPKLYVFVLRSNRFNGSLPFQMCFLNKLQFLDMSNNSLLGNIPWCFSNFTAMATRGFQNDITSHSYYTYGAPLPETKPQYDLITYNSFSDICSQQDGIYFSCDLNDEALFIDSALVAWKGTQREFGKSTLHLLKSIDISSNKLDGKLPSEITNLLELVSLNFSNNKLHGELPKDMGRLRSLESLDLSRNEFSGNIPLSLSQITPLSYLDLSNNNLSGRIPLGPQLQLFNSSSYTGNPQLCGSPLTERCGPPPPPDTVFGKEDVEEDGDEFWISYYTGMGVGFAVGFLGICGVLFLNRWCRYLFFASLNSMTDWIYVTTVVHFQSLHRKCRQ
ncbi:putative leucine-rich repeat-containing, plant-type, leucine-rich repeat domain superfamily [Helianthus annuus]|nr:putative leucine-rich repeat-containing, plant-type, leucine-rich repeat domain superfamily [Helianthus annuus]KAJ0732357.1 putative leucine-rich repeat-containing, plant-type, leucine-rich repeat domain superfamily [Helianthus annuus]